MSRVKIKCILLDIGDVLLQVDWSRFEVNLGRPNSGVAQAIRKQPLFDAFERGQISALDFFTEIKIRFKLESNVGEIARAWDAVIVGEIPGACELIESYANRAILFYALTNASPTHIELEAKKYPVFKNFNKILTSYELGYRKPSPEIYIAALKEMNCSPEQVLFVDDLPENVAAAKNLGFHAEICSRSAAKLEEIFAHHVSS